MKRFLFGFLISLTILFWGRFFGRQADNELQRAKQPYAKTEVPEKWRWLFHFTWSSDYKVVKCALWSEILSYAFAGVVLVVTILAPYFPRVAHVIQIGSAILYVAYIVTVALIAGSHSSAEAAAEADNYDLDWIARIQHSCGMLKKRRCKVIREAAPGIYIIRCGILIPCCHRATTAIPVEIGHRYYAVHNYDATPCFWQIRDH